MILIADSGSTKCDWSLIRDHQMVAEYSTMGFNPFYHNQEAIAKGILANSELVAIKDEIKGVRYLGSGCSDSQKRTIVHQGLMSVFSQAEIVVEHDLLGAAYATYDGEPSITGILGTGSNACLFDGTNLIQKTPSLGFIMGDEGGGGYFGKKLVTAYCYNTLDVEIAKDFEKSYQMSIPQLIHRVNSEPHANVFLAGFMPFFAKHKSNPGIHKILLEGIEAYFNTHILPFDFPQNLKINFIGSVAFFFQDIVSEVAHRHGLQIGVVIQKPGSRIVDYFLKYVFV